MGSSGLVQAATQQDWYQAESGGEGGGVLTPCPRRRCCGCVHESMCVGCSNAFLSGASRPLDRLTCVLHTLFHAAAALSAHPRAEQQHCGCTSIRDNDPYTGCVCRFLLISHACCSVAGGKGSPVPCLDACCSVSVCWFVCVCLTVPWLVCERERQRRWGPDGSDDWPCGCCAGPTHCLPAHVCDPFLWVGWVACVLPCSCRLLMGMWGAACSVCLTASELLLSVSLARVSLLSCADPDRQDSMATHLCRHQQTAGHSNVLLCVHSFHSMACRGRRRTERDRQVAATHCTAACSSSRCAHVLHAPCLCVPGTRCLQPPVSSLCM